MKKSKIIYNPYLSIAENAINNRVSEASIRRYIRLNGIDRKKDNAIIIQRSILHLIKKKPDISITEISRQLNLARNTVKKYIRCGAIQSNSDSLKLSTFDTSKQKFIISSVSDSQDKILSDILRLYVHTKRYDCDLTYSKGNFYRRIPEPRLKFDKYPLQNDVRRLDESINIDNSSLESIVIDLPFVLRTQWKNGGGKIIDRFDCFETISELERTNRNMIDLAFLKLKKGGYLVIKTMDIHLNGKFHSISNLIINYATSKGFRYVDIFILVSKSKMLINADRVQRHARKFHSYFLVFRK